MPRRLDALESCAICADQHYESRWSAAQQACASWKNRPRSTHVENGVCIDRGAAVLAIAVAVAGCGGSAQNSEPTTTVAGADAKPKPRAKPKPAPTRYGQLFTAAMTPQKAARPICRQYERILGIATEPAQTYLRDSAPALADAYAADAYRGSYVGVSRQALRSVSTVWPSRGSKP